MNEKTAYRLASEGKLPGFKVGGSWRFKRTDLEAWIEKQKNSRSKKASSKNYKISSIPIDQIFVIRIH
ncbi:helix-turn-helix domain-containing protein [Providencia stuartii]|uniref:helix-turn-helix domain-containing protein n=1 Tax=Providencia stuartii TaxID=588 RepID=UPI003D9EC015